MALNQTTILLNIVNSDATYDVSKAFSKTLTLDDLKSRLEMMLGFMKNEMRINAIFQDGSEKILENLKETIEEMGLLDNTRLVVSGESVLSADQECEFYKMPKNVYEQKKDTLYSFKKTHKLGRFGKPENDNQNESQENTDQQLINDIHVGDRCQVSLNNQRPKRGLIKFVGSVKFTDNLLVGVMYDEPFGNHNGTYKGHEYFSCPDKYGSFVKPQFVQVGDYPEELDEM